MAKKTGQQLTIIKPIKPPTNLKMVGNRLAKAKTPEEVLAFDADLAGYEAYMRKAGYSQGHMHEINEHRMRARWRLGQMLADPKLRGKTRIKERAVPQSTFNSLIQRLGLKKPRAIEAQRIGYLPKIELEKIFQKAREKGELVTIQWLVDAARPYWYKASREAKHQDIADEAAAVSGAQASDVRPFPLLYVDPPTEFTVYSEKGLGKAPDQHYPTMSDQEIVDYIKPFIPDVGAILWWCTSSNLARALSMLDQLNIDFKSSAVWVKTKPDSLTAISGMGLVFRNMHEILLYGTRGNMPGPQYQPPSVFFYPRGRHSAKPPEIRKEIEKMYPDFDVTSRAELFCRDQPDGWTTFGFEAGKEEAAE